MKKWILLLTLLASVNPAFGRNVQKSPSQPAAEKEPPCRSYIVVEAATGKVLEGSEVHLKWPPASVTKLMLAEIVLERVAKGALHFSDKVTVSREASKMGGSQVYLKEGETFTLEELMKATMVASANDAAYAIAEYVAGTREKFVEMMNEKARTLNMQDTTFHSPHGLPPSEGESEDLTSTSDLAILARELLLKYPKILEWTSVLNDTFRNGTFVLNNHNKLLARMPGMDGLKTGYYGKAGYNVVATARKEGLRLIVVVLGSPTHEMRNRLAVEKFKTYFAAYETVHVVKKGDVIEREVYLPDGKTPRIKPVAAEDFSCPVLRGKKGTVVKEYNLPEKIEGEIKEGQVLGEMVIKADNEVMGKVKIVSPVAVPRASFVTKFFRIFGISS